MNEQLKETNTLLDTMIAKQHEQVEQYELIIKELKERIKQLEEQLHISERIAQDIGDKNKQLEIKLQAQDGLGDK